jgi:3-deoxy-7-phosphoheptulonate synthase
MAYLVEKTIRNSEEIKKEYPLENSLKILVEKHREEIKNILGSKDNRLIIILGPCSAWPLEAVKLYAKKIKEFDRLYGDKLKFILRVYSQKPRTSLGWTGPVNQLNPFLPSNIEVGLVEMRKLMIEITRLDLAIADEALFTHNEGYFDDILSWIAIGARSSEDQEHRIYASMLDIPVGIKNPSSGDLNVAMNSVLTSRHSHVFLLNNKQIRTFGNQYSHIVLRGGNNKSNLNASSFKFLEELFIKNKIVNSSIIADCSHDNSIIDKSGRKDYKKQPEILINFFKEIKEHSSSFKLLKGFMIESFIKSGSQDIKKVNSTSDLDLSGLSITDPCIGIEETKILLKNLYDIL